MIYILFILLSLGSLGRITYGPSVAIYLYEPLLAAYLCYTGLHMSYNAWANNRAFGWIYGFLGIMGVSYLISVFRFSPWQNAVALMYLIRLSMYLLAIPVIAYDMSQQSKRRTYERGLWIYIILTAIYSLVQYMFYPNLRNLAYLGWDPHQNRMFGTVFDVSYASALYGLIGIYAWIAQSNVAAFLTYIGLGLFTYDRGYYLSMILTTSTYLFMIGRRIMIPVVIAALLIGIFALPKKFGEGVNIMRTSTVESRARDYQSAWEVARANLLTGVGYDHIRYVKPGENDVSHAGASYHSSYMVVLVSMGLFGLGMFLVMLYVLARTSPIAMYTLIFLGVFGFIDNVFMHPLVLFLEGILIAWGITSRTSQ